MGGFWCSACDRRKDSSHDGYHEGKGNDAMCTSCWDKLSIECDHCGAQIGPGEPRHETTDPDPQNYMVACQSCLDGHEAMELSKAEYFEDKRRWQNERE